MSRVFENSSELLRMKIGGSESLCGNPASQVSLSVMRMNLYFSTSGGIEYNDFSLDSFCEHIGIK